MGSYDGKITKRRMIFSTALIGVLVLLVCMSILLEGKAYYIFAINTPLGTLLYLASTFRYLEEPNAGIILDISYLIILLVMICSVAISVKKQKTIRIVYAICFCDILLCLLLSNVLGLIGDIVIIAIAIFSTK